MVKYFGLISFKLFLNIFISFDFCIDLVLIFDLSNKQKTHKMTTLSTFILVAQLVLFTLFVANVGKLIISLTIKEK